MKHYLTLLGVVTVAVIVGITAGYVSRTNRARLLQASSQIQSGAQPITREQMARLIAQTAAHSAARAANSVIQKQAAITRRQRLVASVESGGAPSGVSMQNSAGLKAH